ncbi:unnamed protein product [Sphagnum compactum]
MESGDDRQPLLSASAPHFTATSSHLSAFRPLPGAQGQYATGSSQIKASVPPVETASLATANEIREAASQDPYPKWIYGALVAPDPPLQQNFTPGNGSIHGDYQRSQGPPPSVEGLHEEEIRELLTDYVDRYGCWGRRPAHKWSIEKVEDCNVFIGTLETFIEEREVVEQVKPYTGGQVDDNTGAHAPGPWEVDMRNEFPLLFISRKEAILKLPHSESVAKCPDCHGRKEVACPSCNKKIEGGTYKSLQFTECPRCYGRGLLAHQDGSDSKCRECDGKGRIPCTQCSSRGLIKCKKCDGSGALLEGKLLTVTWRTLVNKKISASHNATLVPDEVFHEAKGLQLYVSEAYQCHPISFPNSQGLTKLSSDVIRERNHVPASARVICERHQIHMIPVTRVTAAEGKSSFKFYIVGLEKRIFLKDYPSACCMDGVCTIL